MNNFLYLYLLDESAKLVDGKEHVAWEGTDFPRDRHRPFCNLHHQRLVITIDWKNSLGKSRFSIQFDDHESFTRHAKELVDINAVRDRRLGLSPSVSLEECLFAFAGAEEQLDENSWYTFK